MKTRNIFSRELRGRTLTNKDALYYWAKLIGYICSVAKGALHNPNFVFSFLVIMTISSAGIWAPYLYDLNLSPVCAFSENSISLSVSSPESSVNAKATDEKTLPSHIGALMKRACDHVDSMPKHLFQGFSIFMFSLGILGGIAFDFFVSQRERVEQEDSLSIEESNMTRTKEFAGFFVWVMAILFSSYGLKQPTVHSSFALFGGVLAVFLWICTHHNKAPFKQKPPEPENIEAGGQKANHGLTGEGLS